MILFFVKCEQNSFVYEETGSETTIEHDDSPTKLSPSKLDELYILFLKFVFNIILLITATKRGRIVGGNLSLLTPSNRGKYKLYFIPEPNKYFSY